METSHSVDEDSTHRPPMKRRPSLSFMRAPNSGGSPPLTTSRQIIDTDVDGNCNAVNPFLSTTPATPPDAPGILNGSVDQPPTAPPGPPARGRLSRASR